MRSSIHAAVIKPRKLRAMLFPLTWAIAGQARAEQQQVPLRIELNATSDCRSADAFYEHVSERTKHVRRAGNGELGWSVAISVKAVGNRRLARMKLQATEGEWIERELVAPDCGGALEAMAVVLAVLIDTAVDQAQAAEKVSPPSAPSKPSKPIALPRVATGVYIPWIDDPEFFEKRGISLSPSRFVPSLFGSAEADSQLGTEMGFGLGFGLEIERWSASKLRPRVGLSLGWATSDLRVQEGLTADVQRWSLRAHLCPFDLFQARVFNLRPCIRVDGGFTYMHLTALEASPANVSRRMLRTSPYLQWVLAPRTDLEFRLDCGLDLLLVRPRFAFRYQNEARYQAPHASGLYAAISVSVKY